MAMLLPSALPCDGRQPTAAQRQRPLLRRFMPFSGALTSTEAQPVLSVKPESSVLPPLVDTTCISGLPSPLLSPTSISSGLQSTCRALQSLLGVTPSSTTLKPKKRNQIPSPPAETSHLSERLPIHEHQTRHINTVQPPLPSRGKNKRTRDEYEIQNANTSMDIDTQEFCTGSHYNSHYDSAYVSSSSSPDLDPASDSYEKGFSTPKRRRLPGPTELPFGLERQDFADLESTRVATASQPMNLVSPQSKEQFSYHGRGDSISGSEMLDASSDEVDDAWTLADDAQLVTVVLEKMNLSRRDWEECARVLGAEGEGGSLGKRWKWLMDEGKIGLKMGIKERGRFEGGRASRRQARADVRTVF